MAKRGPKTKFNELIQAKFIELTEKGKTLEQISRIFKVDPKTLSRWLNQHQELCLSVREARQIADNMVEASLLERATGYSHPETKAFCYEGCIVTEDFVKHYPPDTTAAMFWLRNRQPERWKEKTDGDVNVNTSVSVNNLTDEQVEAKIAALIEKKGSK